MRKHIFLLVALVMSVCKLSAADWYEVTALHIKTPIYYDGADSEWTFVGSANGNNIRANCREFWYAGFDYYQKLALPKGHYRLSVNAYQRMEDNSQAAFESWRKDTKPAYIYAKGKTTVKQTVKHVYSEVLSGYNLDNWDGYWMLFSNQNLLAYPNSMETAGVCFFLYNMYRNELEFDVTNDGDVVTLGITNDNQKKADNWCIFSNWKLEWYGDVTPVTKITMGKLMATLSVGETLTLTPTIAPEDATIPILAWSSDNESVATVDKNGVVRAINAGTAIIQAAATDGSGKTAQCKVTVRANVAGLKDLKITEIQSANIDRYIDPSWNYGGWIELHNPTASPLTLTGCYLSDDPANLKKYQISELLSMPAGSYHCFYFDHNDQYCQTQIPFKLDVEGGVICLSDKNGKLLAKQEFPEAVSRCSYARKSVTSDEWGWSATPTPGTDNGGMVYATQRLEAPVIDKDSQIFGTSLQVCVNIPEGATLLYTVDGSTPSDWNPYSMVSEDGLFYVDATTTYRFVLVAGDKLPSPVVTRTYIYQDKNFTLPVFSVASDNENLWGYEYGVFTRGSGNGRPGNGQSSPCNWNMDWERPVNFEYINEEGQMVVNQETALERCGGWSRAWTPYSFKIKANKQYELQSFLPYQFFAEKPYLKHKTLQMRNGGNDTSNRIKDAALQTIVFRSGLNVDCQGYQPAMYYINGLYAGVLNVREPNNKHYVYANYGLDDEEIDQFEMSPDSGYVQKCGTKESFQYWYDLSAYSADDNIYEQIRDIVDIDEFCNYMAIELYLGATDWPQNNIKAFKPVMEGGKFRFVLFDLDGTFATNDPFNTFSNKQTHTFDKLYGQPVDRLKLEIELVTIFKNMLQNERFRKQFIDSFCLVAGSVFEPTRCRTIISELANRVASAQSIRNDIYGSGSSPWSTANTLIDNLSTWRQTALVNAMRSFEPMQLSNVTPFAAQLSTDLPQARLFVNDLPVPTNVFNGRLMLPITLRAEAPAGYKFAGWKMVTGSAGEQTLVATDSEWKYYDQGNVNSDNWMSSSYSDASWDAGDAPLGYGKTVNSTLSYGSDSNNKYPTYYFRQSFNLDQAPKDDDVLTLNYTADDGFVVYLNGEEAARYNMPGGTITYNTYATSYAESNPDAGSLKLDPALLKKGKNVIAVEVHNCDNHSSDIFWNASLTYGSKSKTGTFVSTDEEYELTSASAVDLQACYEPMTDEEKKEAEISLAPVVVNEVSAANSVNINDYYKKDDWIELYNTTNKDIDLEGMYLTDKSSNPKKYKITAQGTEASTIIPAHGYKIIWCSKRSTDKELHANFKLDNEAGCMVRLMAADEAWADSLVYCTMEGDQSVGRYPDGGAETYVMPTSISKSNRMTTYATLWEYVPSDDEDAIADVLESANSREGGMSIAYVGDMLKVKSEENAHVVVTVSTLSGANIMYRVCNLSDTQHATVSVAGLPTGVYLAVATDSEGNRVAVKFAR